MTLPELNYLQIGSQGPELLLLHGWQKNIDHLYPLAKLLSRDFQVEIIDLPGFGKSPALPEDSGTGDYVEAVRQHIINRNLKPHILGHSFGGKIALKLSAQYPDTIKDLILIGTPGLPRKVSLWRKLRRIVIRLSGNAVKLFDRIFRTKYFEKEFAARFGSADYRAAGTLRKLLVKTVNEDLSSFAVQVKNRTLLLWGSRDEDAPVAMARTYRKLLQNSELIELSQHEHSPFEDVGAHLCYLKIKEFLLKNA